MSVKPTTITLGDEYDDVLRDALKAVLVENRAVGLNKSWGVGGSQEIETLEVSIHDDVITIESETFVGLTITGAKPVVEAIAKQVLEWMKKRGGKN